MRTARPTSGYRVEVRGVTPTPTVTHTADPTSSPSLTPSPPPTRTPSPTLPAGQCADGCEPNEDFAHACALGLHTTSPPQTLPNGDQDVFVGDTGAPDPPVTVYLWQPDSLSLVTTLYDARYQYVGTLASPTVSTTLPTALQGPLYLVVQSRSLAAPQDETYRIEVRRGGSGASERPPPGRLLRRRPRRSISPTCWKITGRPRWPHPSLYVR